jgi:RNA polymerase sigma-70 factor, ECF subfamily
LEKPGPQQYDERVELLIGVQKQLARYVRALVPNCSDAEEVLQEANLFIWHHADQYEPGTNFAAWASKIAYYQVLTYRKRQARARRRFSDVLVDELASTADRNAAWQNNDLDAFEQCFNKLSEQDRELVGLRYEPGATVESIAQTVGRSTAAVYKALGRIRTWLLECMHRCLSEKGKT